MGRCLGDGSEEGERGRISDGMKRENLDVQTAENLKRR